jgi:DnaJ-class molecular chaperone
MISRAERIAEGRQRYGTIRNDTMVTCPQCNGKGTVKDEVARGPVMCDACGGKGKVEKSYADQFKNEVKECRICGKKFDSREEVTKHVVTAHKENMIHMYQGDSSGKCMICGRSSATHGDQYK